MKHLQTYFLLYVAVLLAGCTALGLPKAQTFEEKLTAGYATATAANQSVTALLKAKKIGSEDAEHVVAQVKNAVTGLDVARTMRKSDPKAADSKLTTVRAALTALQSYLAAKEK